MLIGSSRRRPNLEGARRIKTALREALGLADDVTITVTELACLEEDCAPVETVFGLLRPDAPQLQCKLHKPMNAVDAGDLAQVCSAWGFEADIRAPAPLPRETRP